MTRSLLLLTLIAALCGQEHVLTVDDQIIGTRVERVDQVTVHDFSYKDRPKVVDVRFRRGGPGKEIAMTLFDKLGPGNVCLKNGQISDVFWVMKDILFYVKVPFNVDPKGHAGSVGTFETDKMRDQQVKEMLGWK